MTHNNLFLNRLVIYTQDNKIAYDQLYHRGVNIISGDNSSGKSTITHFIFYVLGGAFNDWVKEAKRCSAVVAEVVMNGATITLKRHVEINPATGKGNAIEPIYIYWGNFIDSQKATAGEWLKFNYNTTESKKSFSNVFFESLDIPVVKGENNITFHQILRLLYVDQDSPTSSLFYYEQFDTTLTRETVSDLLLGVYNQQLYDSKQRLIDAENELDDIKREIRVIRQFVPNAMNLVPQHIKVQIDNKKKQIQEIEADLILLKENKKRVVYRKDSKLDFEKLNEESLEQREKVNELDTKVRSFGYEIEDTKLFISALERKLNAIKHSVLTREYLGEFPLEYCPECLSDIKEVDDTATCKLCKEKIDSSFGVTKAKKIEQELSFQIKESRNLLGKKIKEFEAYKLELDAERNILNIIQNKVNSALNDVKSVRDEKIDGLYIDKGFIEGELLQLYTLLENAESYQRLLERRTALEEEVKTLHISIRDAVSEQEKLKQQINAVIEKKALYLLNNDLRRQADFIYAKEFNIDYRNNIAFISDKDAKYSASSNFYLKTTARYAIFLASLDNQRMRYPRFILCDNMEDKGIEAIRAQNFQKIIIAEVEKYKTDEYQVIYTTSYLPEELKDSAYIVGEYYTEQNPSLKNV